MTSFHANNTTAHSEVPAAWMTWLTTEHYNLQTQRVATIGEANGRASVFLGALSAGLIALGFQNTGQRSTGTTTFQVVVLSALVVLGALTFLRCLQIAVDDWDFGDRIRHLRTIYTDLLPDLAVHLTPLTGQEQAVVMLRPVLGRLQALLTVAGSVCVITAIVFGGDIGTLSYGLHLGLGWAICIGFIAGLIFAVLGVRFQTARWNGAEVARHSLAPRRPPGTPPRKCVDQGQQNPPPKADTIAPPRAPADQTAGDCPGCQKTQ